MTTKERWDAIFAKGQTFTLVGDAELDMILERAGKPKTALDIACGTGDLVVKLVRRGIVTTGTDVSPVALSKAQEALSVEHLSATLVEADFNEPDLVTKLGGPYEVVFMRLAFAFVQDRDALLEEVKKIIKPGGAFACILPGLLPTGQYDDRQRRISLPKEELEETLKRHFQTVNLLIEDTSVQSDWPLLTYVCR